jgi:hypothetical protein
MLGGLVVFLILSLILFVIEMIIYKKEKLKFLFYTGSCMVLFIIFLIITTSLFYKRGDAEYEKAANNISFDNLSGITLCKNKEEMSKLKIVSDELY